MKQSKGTGYAARPKNAEALGCTADEVLAAAEKPRRIVHD